MKDTRKSRKKRADEPAAPQRQTAVNETPATGRVEQGPPDQSLRDLIEIIQFTETAATKVHGLLDENEIYEQVKQAFIQSRRYTVSLLLLKENGKSLRIAATSVPSRKLRGAEKATGLRLKGFEIDLTKSSLCRRVTRDGETVRVQAADIVDELFSPSLAPLISASMGYEKRQAIITPLEQHGEIIGVLALSSVGLSENFVPSAMNLARHVSTALELARENAERRQAEQQLRESEARYRALYQSIRDGIVATDLRGRIIDCNDAYLEMLGYTREELEGSRFRKVVPSRWHAHYKGVLEEVMERGYSYEYEEEHLRKDGAVLPISLRTWRVDDESGKAIGAWSIVRDITNRRQAEEELARARDRLEELVEERTAALAASEERYRIVSRLTSDFAAAFRTGPDGQLIPEWTTPALERITGYTGEELTARGGLMGILHPDDLPAAQRTMQALLERGQGYIDEYRIITKSGAVRWLRDYAQAVRDRSGTRPTRLYRAAQDITERKQAEETLKFRVEQLAALSQASQAVTASLDLDQVLARIVSLAAEVLAADFTSVVLTDEKGKPAEGAEDLPGLPAIEHRTRDRGFTRWIAHSRQPVIVDAVNPDGTVTPSLGKGAPRRANPLIVQAGVRSLAGLPLIAKDHLLGVLYLHSLRPDAFGNQLSLLTAFASQAAIAIENARLYETAQWELEERRRTEEALRVSQEYARSIVDSSLDMIITVDNERRIVEFNQAAQEAFGYTPQEIIGKPADTLYADRQESSTIHKATIEEGRCVKEILNRRKSGEVFPSLLSASILRDAQGKAIGIMGISRDITRRKQTERLMLAQRDLGLALGTTRGLDETLRLCLDAAIDVSGMDCGGIYLVDPASGELDLAMHRGLSRQFIQATSHYEAGSANARMVLAGQPVYGQYQDIGTFARTQVKIGEALRAIAVIPIQHENRVTACINIASHTADVVPEVARVSLEAIAAQVGSAVARSRAEEALRKSEERYRQSVENSPNPIFSVDREGIIRAWNQACGEVFQYQPGEMLGQPYHRLLWNPEDQPTVDALLAQAWEGHPLSHQDMIYRAADGAPRFTVSRLYPVYGAGGQAQECVFANTDITERKLADEALRESEEMYKTLAETSPESVTMSDLEGRLIYASQRAIEAHGGDGPQDLLGKNAFELIVPEERERAKVNALKTLEQGVVRDLEYTMLRKDGSRYVGELNVALIRDAYGRPKAFMATTRDITNRKQAEEALQRYAERLSILHEIDQSTLEAQSPYDIAHATLRYVQRLVPCEQASVAVFDRELSRATILAGASAAGISMGIWIPLEPFGEIIDTIRRGQVYTIDDISTVPHMPPIVQQQVAAGVRAFTCVPLMAQNELIGALNLSSNAPGRLDREDSEIVLEVADHLAIALQQARLHEQVREYAEDLELRVAERTAELQRRTTQLQVAAEVARDAAAASDVSDLLERAANLIRDRFQFTCVGIYLVENHSHKATLRAATGEAGRRMLEGGYHLAVDADSAIGQVAASGQPSIISDTRADAARSGDHLLADTRSEMALPLQVGRQAIGVLDVQSNREAAFSQDDAAVLQIMADQLAVTIERGRLFEKTQSALEERLQTVVSNAPIVLTVLDRDGVFTLSEGKGLEAIGLEPGQHIGTSAFDLYRGQPEVLESIRRALKGERISPILKVSGVTFETRYSPLRGEDGEITGVMGVGIDVTEREKAQEALRRNEAHFRALIENASDMIMVLDKDGVIRYGSPIMERELVYGPEGFVDKRPSHFVHPDDLPTILQAFATTLQKPGVRPYVEFRLPHKDGTWHLYEAVANNLLDDPVVEGIVVNARDVTERKQAEEARRESQRLLEKTFASLRDAVFIIDAESTEIIDCNPAARDVFGYDREEMIGRRIAALHVDEAAAEEFRKQLVVAAEEKGFLFLPEFAMKRKNGVIFPTENSVVPLTDEQDRRVGWVGVVRDITERRHLEEHIRRQDRLAAIGQLAGGTAHDFNNFLTSIMLYAQLITGKPDLPPDVKSSTKIILEESRRAAHLVQQILDFSRRSMMDTQPIDLMSFINDTVDILRRTLPENIRLTLQVEPGQYVVRIDPTRIQQVVMNMAVNARDAMPDGGELRIGISRIRLEADQQAGELPPGDWVCLEIADTGTGMNEEVQAHLFEPFFTTKKPGEGTGLGLAQVYGIVKQHEGHISFETQVGRGTTFHVCLPAYEADGQEAALEETPPPPPGQGEIILLVEDERRVREAGQEILASLGYQVLAAANGAEALDVYRSAERVDLLVTDLVMPEMGGKELIQELREGKPDLKVVAITGYAVAEELQALKEAGILEIVQKPLEVSKLARVIRQALDSR